MINKTFRLRLTILYSTVVVIIFFSLGLVLYIRYSRALDRHMDQYLIREAQEELEEELRTRVPALNAGVIRRYGDEYYEVVNRHGEILISSISSASLKWPLHRDLMLDAFTGNPSFVSFAYRGENFRMLYFPAGEDRVIRVAVSMSEVESGLRDLRHLFFFLSPVICLIAFGMSWFLSGKALDPVVRITSLVEQVRQGRLGNRVEMEMKGKEIDNLVRIFNDMLDSIQRSIEAQKRFTSDVSHEIRSPLTALRGGIEVALRKRRSPDEYEELLRNNLSDIMRLSRITDNLLFFSRADNNIVEVRKQWFDVSHMLWGIVERLRYKAESSRITITEEYEEGLELNGDMDLIEQAVSNIIDNALTYTPAGGSVTITSQRKGPVVRVTISDTGIGIPQADIPHIFERFYRVSKERSRKSGGTGLGLSITHWIITAHGGTISVKSTPGKGSVFTVTLPAPTEGRR